MESILNKIIEDEGDLRPNPIVAVMLPSTSTRPQIKTYRTPEGEHGEILYYLEEIGERCGHAITQYKDSEHHKEDEYEIRRAYFDFIWGDGERPLLVDDDHVDIDDKEEFLPAITPNKENGRIKKYHYYRKCFYNTKSREFVYAKVPPSDRDWVKKINPEEKFHYYAFGGEFIPMRFIACLNYHLVFANVKSGGYVFIHFDSSRPGSSYADCDFYKIKNLQDIKKVGENALKVTYGGKEYITTDIKNDTLSFENKIKFDLGTDIMYKI